MDFQLETFEPSKIYGLYVKNPRIQGDKWTCTYGINTSSRKKAIAKFRELYGPDLDVKEWKVGETGPLDCKVLSDEEFIEKRDLFARNRASGHEIDQKRAQERAQE